MKWIYLTSPVAALCSAIYWAATGYGWWAPVGDGIYEMYRGGALVLLHFGAAVFPAFYLEVTKP